MKTFRHNVTTPPPPPLFLSLPLSNSLSLSFFLSLSFYIYLTLSSLLYSTSSIMLPICHSSSTRHPPPSPLRFCLIHFFSRFINILHLVVPSITLTLYLNKNLFTHTKTIHIHSTHTHTHTHTHVRAHTHTETLVRPIVHITSTKFHVVNKPSYKIISKTSFENLKYLQSLCSHLKICKNISSKIYVNCICLIILVMSLTSCITYFLCLSYQFLFIIFFLLSLLTL